MAGPNVPSFGVALGHINGDAHLDAVFANGTGGVDQVCLGDGNGDFTCGDFDSSSSQSLGVAAGYLQDTISPTASSKRSSALPGHWPGPR